MWRCDFDQLQACDQFVGNGNVGNMLDWNIVRFGRWHQVSDVGHDGPENGNLFDEIGTEMQANRFDGKGSADSLNTIVPVCLQLYKLLRWLF